jgi:hypothetical protein
MRQAGVAGVQYGQEPPRHDQQQLKRHWWYVSLAVEADTVVYKDV